jgi:RNA polymerase-associated protein
MILYSDRDDHYSQRVRIVLAEKDISAEINETKPEETSDEILSISPYHKLPILVDRDLAIHDPSVMMEYLDERFPHPPLMPVDPVVRAQFRMALHRIENDWYSLVEDFLSENEAKLATKPKKLLKESILSVIDLFTVKDYFISDDFSLVDCTIAPILWRLPVYGIDLGSDTASIEKYMDRVFDRPSFQSSLSELEQEMRL